MLPEHLRPNLPIPRDEEMEIVTLAQIRESRPADLSGVGYPTKWTGMGMRKKLESPEVLWELAMEYFQYMETTPFKKKEIIKGGWLAGTTFDVDTQRPYTWYGLELWVMKRIGLVSLEHYKKNLENRYSEYLEVIQAIEKVIYTQKFEGAAVLAFEPRIIAMELGLAQKVENTVKVEQPLFSDNPITPPDEILE